MIGRAIKTRPGVLIGGLVLTGVVAGAILAPVIAPYGVTEQVGAPFERPSSEHWLGLDDGGIDMVTLLLWGARVSLIIGFAAALVSALIGGGLGIAAGYWGGWVERSVMIVNDYFLVIPVVPLMITIATIWNATLTTLIVIIGALLWTTTARLMRAQVLSLRERAYVRRCRTLGGSHLRVIRTHIVPVSAPLLIAATIPNIGAAIFYEAALAFFGLGDPSHVSWGTLIENAFQRTAVSAGAWWAFVPPGIAIAVVIISCALVARGLEEWLSPRLRTSQLGLRPFEVVAADRVTKEPA